MVTLLQQDQCQGPSPVLSLLRPYRAEKLKIIHSTKQIIVIIEFLKPANEPGTDAYLEHCSEDRRPGAEDVCVAGELLHSLPIFLSDLQHNITEKLLRACQQLGEVGAQS